MQNIHKIYTTREENDITPRYCKASLMYILLTSYLKHLIPDATLQLVTIVTVDLPSHLETDVYVKEQLCTRSSTL